jgi:type VI secretion system protein ImpF
MARIDPNLPLVPSILDRLIDPGSGGTRGQSGYTIERMVQAVRRDLEDLLNTRRCAAGISAGFKEVLSSVIVYGLPDLTTVEAITAQQRAALAGILERIISQFEPRLRDVKASLLDANDEKLRTLRFRIDAKLRVDPAPEVAFDTFLELSTGHYSVRRRGD